MPLSIQIPRQVTLSKGERLLLARRHADMTQAKMAGIFGVAVHRLKLWEHDERDDIPAVKVTAFCDRDWCYIQRRREGWLLRDLAERTGLAAKWLHRAERGDVKDIEPLVEWWRQWLAAKESRHARPIVAVEELLS